MKKKNGLLTLIFACIPGAGQMYLGYMKRGLSLVSVFALLFWLTGTVMSSLIVFVCIVFMYSFFDTLNLRAQLMEGSAPPDDYLVQLGTDTQLQKMFKSSHKLVGWALVAAGAYSLYENFMRSIISELWERQLYWLANLLEDIPTLVMCVALILVGLWLVRGPRSGPAQEDIHYYQAAASAPQPEAGDFDLGGAPQAPAAPRPFAQQPWAGQAVEEMTEQPKEQDGE